MKKKLSTTQERVLTLARSQVQEAKKAQDFTDYYITYRAQYYGYKKLEDLHISNLRIEEDCYRKLLQGIVLTHAGGATLRKLEELGLIHILKDATGSGSYTFDEVQLL